MKNFIKNTTTVHLTCVLPSRISPPTRPEDGPYYLGVSDIPVEGGRICFDGGTAGLGLHLDADEAKSVSKGDRLHIRGKVSFSVDNGRLGRFAYRSDGSHSGPTYSWFWFENPTITIEQTESSSRLKDAVATKVADLRKLEAGEPKGKKSEPLGEERFPIPDKEAKVVGKTRLSAPHEVRRPISTTRIIPRLGRHQRPSRRSCVR